MPKQADNLAKLPSAVDLPPVSGVAKPRRARTGVVHAVRQSLGNPRKALAIGLIEAIYAIQRLWRRDWIFVDPEVPSRSFTLWKLSRLAGIRLVGLDALSERPKAPPPLARFRHRDVTWDEAADQAQINGGCLDISKSRVDREFALAFGYASAIDPTAHHGVAVCKSEINGTHSGELVMCPLPPEQLKADHIYQRLVSNEVAPGIVSEYRVAILGYRAVFALETRRDIDQRLAGRGQGGRGSTPKPVEAVFSTEDRSRIETFCRGLGLEAGELDILPDRDENRIYILDANKTPTTVTST
ncbi:MAG: hypothetical protein AAF678_12015, partial [Pseudomonadota bacterium]